MKRLVALLMAVLFVLTGCAISKTDKKKPTDDGVLRILMIGNSFCYYFTDELYGMLEKAGIKAEVCNVYYSGCDMYRHAKWLEDDSKNYEYITTTSAGRVSKTEYTLKQCLADKEWDVITLQQHFNPDVANNIRWASDITLPYAQKLFDYLKKNHPYAELMWHHTWAYQVGYECPVGGNPNDWGIGQKVLTVEKQTTTYNNIKQVALSVCEMNNVPRIPAGDAWQLARANTLVGDTLCNKNGNNYGDNYHDGDTGGGQYLNACVWFEMVTGQSCVDNTFKPNYSLSDKKITALKAAAHQAVEGMKK